MVSFNKRLTKILEEAGTLTEEQIELGVKESEDSNSSGRRTAPNHG